MGAGGCRGSLKEEVASSVTSHLTRARNSNNLAFREAVQNCAFQRKKNFKWHYNFTIYVCVPFHILVPSLLSVVFEGMEE